MKTYGQLIGKPINLVVCTVTLLLLTATTSMLILSIRQRRKPWIIACEAVHFAWTFYLLFCLFDVQWPFGLPNKASAWILDCPTWVVGLMLALSAAAIVGTSIDSAHYAKTYLWTDSVKQAIDALPVGICVGKDRRMYLVNVRMNEFCVASFGRVFDTVDGLWAQVEEVGEQEGERLLVHNERKAFLFGKSTVQIAGTDYLQILAYDVTEQYRITTELRAKHDKLKEVQFKALELRYQTEALAKSKELLEARVRVHDEIGHILLLGKYYFEHEDQDAEALLTAIKTSSELLMGVEHEVENEEDAVALAVEWAKAIGLSVKLTGEAPRGDTARKVVAQAIKECATNAVKHADANVIEVDIAQEEGQTSVRITNNGRPPEGEIVLSGGLRSLLKAVEEAGGQMRVESTPNFCLNVTLHE